MLATKGKTAIAITRQSIATIAITAEKAVVIVAAVLKKVLATEATATEV